MPAVLMEGFRRSMTSKLYLPSERGRLSPNCKFTEPEGENSVPSSSLQERGWLEACSPSFTPPAVLKGSDMRGNILSGEPLPFHDLPNTSSARYPKHRQLIEIQKESRSKWRVEVKRLCLLLLSGIPGNLHQRNFHAVLTACQADWGKASHRSGRHICLKEKMSVVVNWSCLMHFGETALNSLGCTPLNNLHSTRVWPTWFLRSKKSKKWRWELQPSPSFICESEVRVQEWTVCGHKGVWVTDRTQDPHLPHCGSSRMVARASRTPVS